MAMPEQSLATARSFLFVPGHRPERYLKALESGADAVIIDLEDAVPADDKAGARAAVAAVWPQLAASGRVLVRINAAATRWHEDDVELCAQLKPAGIVIPKAEGSVPLARLAAHVSVPLLPIIESALGWSVVETIAAAPGVLRLVFGNIDFQVDLGMQCDDSESELWPVRLALVAASRRAGLAAPVDGVTVQTDDAARLTAAALRARRGGFGAKLCIHPRQIAPVHAGFAPTPDEIAWATRVVAAATESGGGAVQLDGRMIDRPVILLAERTLRMAGA